MRIALFTCILLLLSCSGGNAAPVSIPESLGNQANIAEIQSLPKPAGDEFSFVVIGDSRSGDAVFTSLLSQINAYAASHSGAGRPLFVLHTGDIVPSGKSAEWANFSDMRSALTLPMVFVRGNHELKSGAGAADYANYIGANQWSFDFGGCRFVGLDNAAGSFGTDAAAYLSSTLDAGPAWQHAFVLFHEPPPVGRWQAHSMHDDAHGGNSAGVLAAIGDRHVSAVFLGHIHLYDEMDIGGVPYIISAGGGAPLYGYLGFGKAEHGFVVVHVAQSGVTWDWVPLST